ncbi:MAG: ABC transporter ATP-binding protein [bacterium]
MLKLELNNVTKKYKYKTALDNMNLIIDEPGVVGFFGPNGSGKTTTIKILASLLKQYTGEVLINGLKPGLDTKSIVSYLPDRNFLEDNKKVSYALKIFNDFYLDFDIDLAKSLLEKFKISEETMVYALSKGNKEKLHTILVISRRAKIYLFDEPIAGVDPASREVVFNLITQNCSKDAIVLLTTHLILDVENIIDRAIFIKEGQVVLNETKEQFKSNETSLNDRFKEEFKCF